ncbi:hypothetical protein PENPOL_c002G01565 [Penicillium polonicum]|uniref:SUKH-3 domain-containing protein n=1 Tax=Penicillium polonicum TaxID=60169 RepID=A0A1V6NYH7_PENPO|nr:hypothetical protein PENPOL_c002G01565 [Penicillium polonicum]
MDEKEIETERVLRNAGWRPGRKINTSAWRDQLGMSGFVWTEAAEHFLSEFGGLVINHCGPGISCARSPFELDPLLAEGEDDRFAEWATVLGEPLSPIGQLDHGRFFLGISGSGDIYLVETWLASFGSGQEALKALVLGIAPREIDEHGLET